jgi:hypothetical protein
MIVVNSHSGKGAGNMAGLQRKGGRVEREQGGKGAGESCTKRGAGKSCARSS